VFQNSKSFAAYSQLNFKIAEPLTLVLGGRYTKEKKDGSYSQLISTPFAADLRAPEVLTLGCRLSGDRFTYRIGLNLKPSEDDLAFGSFSTGYKSGGYNSGGGMSSLTISGRVVQLSPPSVSLIAKRSRITNWGSNRAGSTKRLRPM